MAPNTPFYSAKEVCSKLGVCHRTLMKYVKDGKFPEPHKYIRPRLVWLREEVEKWIKQEK